jgi:dolichol-phosphate mannosyltransferase
LKKVLPHDLISFILVGASGAVVQFTTEHLCVGTGLPSATAAATGVSAAILWNFLFNHYLTFHRALTFNIDLLVKFILYTLAVMIGIMLNISAATFSLQKLYTNDFIASILGMCVDTIWRFAVAKAVIWRR